jgi:hypothetical protein
VVCNEDGTPFGCLSQSGSVGFTNLLVGVDFNIRFWFKWLIPFEAFWNDDSNGTLNVSNGLRLKKLCISEVVWGLGVP